MRTPELWLLWWICFCVWGAMTLVNANMELIYRALAGPNGFSKQRNAVYVSIFGLASALGRILVGAVHPHLARRCIDIWAVLPVAPLVMIAGLLAFLVCGARAIVVPFFLIGLGTGLAWGTVVLVIKRVFTEAGRHYNFLYTAGMLTPILWNLVLFAGIFEAESKAQHQPSLNQCEGIKCILISVLVAVGANVTAFIASIVFTYRLNNNHLLFNVGDYMFVDDASEQ